MKTPLSDMTAGQFVEAAAALGLRYNVLAAKLQRSSAQVSMYACGKRPIPVAIATRVAELLAERAAAITALSGVVHSAAAVGQMIVYSNEERQKREWSDDHRHHVALALKRRLHAPDNRMWEPLRLGREKSLLLLQSLADWRIECKRRIDTELDTDNLHKQYRFELADIAVIAQNVPRTVPHEFVFTKSEWHVIARALCWHHKQDPSNVEYGKRYALYQFMRRNKGTGYPVNMMRERRRALAAQQGATP